jgi:hypothetical protein
VEKFSKSKYGPITPEQQIQNWRTLFTNLSQKADEEIVLIREKLSQGLITVEQIRNGEVE